MMQADADAEVYAVKQIDPPRIIECRGQLTQGYQISCTFHTYYCNSYVVA